MGPPMDTRGKLVLLGSLYFSQGLPFGFFVQALPALMRQQGFELQVIGLSTLLTLPWALKFLWAPFVDARTGGPWGPRRSWILPLQAAAIAILLLLAAGGGPERAIGLAVLGFVLLNLVSSTQDIATDALAVDLLAYEERGLGNGVQVAAYRVGMIVGGAWLLVVLEAQGWGRTLLRMALLLGAASLPILAYREPPAGKPGEASPGYREMWLDVLARPGMVPWLVVLALYKCGDAFATAMLRPYLIDAGMALKEIAVLLGLVGFSAGLLGALLGGWLAGRIGRKRALILCGLLQASGVAAYVLPARGLVGPDVLWALTAYEHLVGGMATAALFTVMMDFCRPGRAATDYTVQASLEVISKTLVGGVSGFSAARLGYADHFALSAGLCLATLALIVPVLDEDALAARARSSRDPVIT